MVELLQIFAGCFFFGLMIAGTIGFTAFLVAKAKNVAGSPVRPTGRMGRSMPERRRGSVVAHPTSTGEVCSRRKLEPRWVDVPSVAKMGVMNTTEDLAMFCSDMKERDVEVLRVIFLGVDGSVLGYSDVFSGTTGACACSPKEILSRALLVGGCHRIVLVHNHLSEDVRPSPDDISFTDRMIQASQLLDIKIVDHLIIGYNCYCSIWRDHYGIRY